MRKSNHLRMRRLMESFGGGLLCLGLYKLFLYTNNREQFEDSNALVSLVFALIASVIIFLILEFISDTNSSR
jgi:hypothetical protein